MSTQTKLFLCVISIQLFAISMLLYIIILKL